MQQRRKTCWPLSNESPLRRIEDVRPAEHGPALEEHDLGPAVGGGERGGHPGQAAPDHADAGRAHGSAPARLRAATRAFSQVGKETRPRVTAIGSRSIRTSRRR